MGIGIQIRILKGLGLNVAQLEFNFARLTECISLAQIYKDFDVKIYAKGLKFVS